MDLTGWLEYFTKGLATQMREVRDQGEREIRQDLIISKARKAGMNEGSVAVLSYCDKLLLPWHSTSKPAMNSSALNGTNAVSNPLVFFLI